MTTRLYGDPFVNADQTGTRLCSPYTPEHNVLLKYLRIRFIHFDDPDFTSLTAKIYSSDGTLPQLLLHTSQARTKTDIETNLGFDMEYGFFESYFEFSPTPSLKAGTEYMVVVNGVWNFTTSSYLAWSKAYPDDPHGVDSTKHITDGPFHVRWITSRL